MLLVDCSEQVKYIVMLSNASSKEEVKQILKEVLQKYRNWESYVPTEGFPAHYLSLCLVFISILTYYII